ncbi:sulfotransferase [Actinomadura sp. DC4]|uniref:sulfotransferase family protein n=1 Tax=Actinomadura sp. DC4 TaxID=3055069 RepID=UPI0025B0CB24|nr:sulfotransferase [Actinomadura sp. DC4]MDN3357043.1 sulfotransferase [Actinomadura sp. DC4]
MARPIFVLGCPRSGTTLMRLMLRAHPRIAIPPETRLLLDAYEHRGAYGDLRLPANHQALAEWIVAGAGTRFDGLGLDPRSVAEEIVAGPPTLGSALEIALGAYARRLGKPRWGDKRPGYVQHIDALLRMFPDAQIVHLVRDGRDCVASLKRTPWWHMGVYHAIATWTQALDAGSAAARSLPPDAYIEVQYERLLTDRVGELRRLCVFLEEEYAPSMAAVTPWQRGAERPSEPARRSLNPWEAALCEAVMTDRLLEYGYEPSPAGRPATHHLARYAAVTAHRRLAARKRAMLDLRLRAAESQPLASCLATVDA